MGGEQKEELPLNRLQEQEKTHIYGWVNFYRAVACCFVFFLRVTREKRLSSTSAPSPPPTKETPLESRDAQGPGASICWRALSGYHARCQLVGRRGAEARFRRYNASGTFVLFDIRWKTVHIPRWKKKASPPHTLGGSLNISIQQRAELAPPTRKRLLAMYAAQILTR